MKKDYDIRYQKTNLKRVYFNLNRKTDKDIIEYLEEHKPVQSELKRLIREEIKRTS